VENAGRLVPKDELIRAVWPNVIVTDESLTRCANPRRNSTSRSRSSTNSAPASISVSAGAGLGANRNARSASRQRSFSCLKVPWESENGRGPTASGGVGRGPSEPMLETGHHARISASIMGRRPRGERIAVSRSLEGYLLGVVEDGAAEPIASGGGSL
jgi:hypothetical protein